MLNVYTSFQPKLSKCCHEIRIDNVGDRVIVPEKMVISKNIKKVITFLAVTCSATRDHHKLIHVVVVPQNFFSFFTVSTDKKVWETLV